MPVLTQNLRTAAAYLVWEAGYISRDVGIIAAGAGKLDAGTVLGRITKGALTAVGAAGSPAPAGATITAAPAVTAGLTKVGVHTFTCDIAGATGKWRHEDPDGVYIGTVTTGTEYTGQGLTLTITDAGTDPAVGEVMKVTVSQAEGSGKRVPLSLTAHDGSEVAESILYEGCDATLVDVQRTLTRRLAEVTGDELVWPAGITPTQKAAALAALADHHIIAR